MTDRRVRNIVVVSDLHAGCRVAICPRDGIDLDDGGHYRPSGLQTKLCDLWDHFHHEFVPRVTYGEPWHLVVNGDAIDGTHHGSVTQVSQNIEDQVDMATAILSPIVNHPKCAGYYHIRGTEAHVGKSGQYEEQLAKRLGATRDEHNRYARWLMWFNLCGYRIHFTHHIGTTGSSAYEATAVWKELVEMFTEAGRWGDQPPHMIVRSHRHRFIECRSMGAHGFINTFTTPAWQLKTPFSHKIPGARTSEPQIGGVVIRAGDEDLYIRPFVHRIEPPKTEGGREWAEEQASKSRTRSGSRNSTGSRRSRSRAKA